MTLQIVTRQVPCGAKRYQQPGYVAVVDIDLVKSFKCLQERELGKSWWFVGSVRDVGPRIKKTMKSEYGRVLAKAQEFIDNFQPNQLSQSITP